MRHIIVLFGALLPLALTGLAASETSAPAAGRLTIVRTAVDDLKAVYATVESVHQVSRPVTAVLKRLDAVRGRLVPDGIEVTERTLIDAAARLATLPELVSIQLQAGTAAPFDFNGLVRHAYLRRAPELGDLQINLVSKERRSRASHATALDVRERLRGLPLPAGAVLKVVEVPPGPPVLATLLAEVYGPDADSRRATARKVREAFAAVPFVTDIDDSFGRPGERLRFALDHESLEFHGVEEQAIYDTLAAQFGSFKLPLVILVPVPLTLIGIVPVAKNEDPYHALRRDHLDYVQKPASLSRVPNWQPRASDASGV